MQHTKKSRQNAGSKEMAQNAVTQAQQMEVDPDDMNLSEDEEGGTRIGDIYIPPPARPYCSTKSIGPRLIITKVLNRNFKSYANDVWLGPFFHRFHAIVGPNGSGKSNVIDSMLFVFGYRANKIRCKKLSVLIHNSAKYPNIDSCQVTVHFAKIIDNPDETYDIVDGSAFTISRTAFKDNSSYYQIDDRKKTFKDVAKLLKEHNIDLNHNRFLILQGEVESIATMKPKAAVDGECGHLEYLEDIIGTDRYKEPLLKINNLVEKLTEERTEKHNRCKMAQREMHDLQKPMENAVQYLKLENEYTRTDNLKLQKYLSEKRQALRESEEKRADQANIIKEHDEKYDEIKKQRLEKEAVIKKEIDEHDKMKKKLEEHEQQLKDTFNKYNEIQSSMDSTNKRRKQAKTQLKKEEDNLESAKKIPEKNSSEVQECEKKIEKLCAQKKQSETLLQQNLEQLQSQTKPLIEQKEILSTELLALQADVDKCQADLKLSESELKICQENETIEKRKFESLKNAYQDAKDSLQEKETKLKECTKDIPSIKASLVEKQQTMQKNKIEEKQLITELRTIKADIQEKSSSMQMQKSHNKVLNALMKQKFEGKIPGVLGRLGDLGGIDAKYDVAISTGCGRLDNIVVDTVDTAQACLEYLRKHDIGRGTFIALEKVSRLHAQACQRINTPENAPRLFDLIRVEDQRVSSAFYFSLGDTLVADNLDQGTRISYGAKRYRVVTLSGEVIETSGTMSGGGRTQYRGRMGTTVKTKTALNDSASTCSTADLQNQQIKAEEIQNQINYLQEQQGHLERDIQQLTYQLSQKENELKRCTIDCKSWSQQLPCLESQLKQQQIKVDQTQSDPEQVKRLKQMIEEKTGALGRSKKAAKKISDKVDEIQKEITKIQDEKVKSVEKKLADFAKQIQKLHKNVSQLNVEITTSVRDVKKIGTKIENLKKEIADAEESIKAGTEEREQADKDAIELQAKINDLKNVIVGMQKETASIDKEIAEMKKLEAAGNLARLELEQALQVIEQKITEIKDVIPHLQNKLKPLKLNEIPNETEPEPLKQYTEEELASHKLQDLQYKISVLEEKLKSEQPNLNVIKEYFKKREVYLERVQVLEDVTNKRNEMRQLYDDVRKKRYTEFMQGFTIITRKLKEMYQMITLGGDAELELVDSMDPFSEGVSFSVRPPKKSWKNISNLSGGEKTLSSLALVFALHYYKPSPLYFMDEIDAALDFRNVSIVANYIRARTKNAQFIIISLRSNMFELADFLTGIYKVKDCTSSVTIKNTVEPDCVIQSTQPQITEQNGSQQCEFLNDLPSQNINMLEIQSEENLQTQAMPETSEIPFTEEIVQNQEISETPEMLLDHETPELRELLPDHEPMETEEIAENNMPQEILSNNHNDLTEAPTALEESAAQAELAEFAEPAELAEPAEPATPLAPTEPAAESTPINNPQEKSASKQIEAERNNDESEYSDSILERMFN